MDWNNDGKKDLLTGEADGYIRIFINVGTDASPSFLGYNYLQANGSNFDCGEVSVIDIVDWNSDGKKDVLCGESYGKVMLLLNIGSDASPQFGAPTFIQSGGLDLDVGDKAAPVAVDWNGDGKKDLVVGEYLGRVFFYPNVGTNASPQFMGYLELQAGGAVLDVEYYSRPFVTDWDNDGVFDLVVGNRDYFATPYGGVYLFRGKGPLFANINQISVAAGGTVNLSLNATAGNAGRVYLILGSMSGSSPGVPLPGGGVTLPINWDGFTNLVLTKLNTPVFANFLGVLSGSGTAAAVINAPSVSSSKIGKTMTYAYCLEGTPDWNYASNPVKIGFIP